MWYNVDFKILSVKLMPTFLRRSLMVKWVNVLVSPMDYVHFDFLKNRDENIVKVTHNSQVCYLRKILNDKFDPERRIEIREGNEKTPFYIYTEGEGKTKYFGKKFVYTRSEISGSDTDFIVKIPAELINYQAEIKLLVDYYKLASKRYKIEILT